MRNRLEPQEELEKILLVDDNPGNLQILMNTLRGHGYRLLVARQGEAALAIARKARPELILLDIMMPGIDGYEVCRNLKSDPETKDIAIIFLSALDETRDKVKGFEFGAVDYIAKPFQPEEVIARVSTHLKIHRLEKRLSFRNRELEQANNRMLNDLEAAARVQQALLPGALPDIRNINVAWKFRPCDELAGDSLNVYMIDDRHMGLYVLDVSGHGVPAALLSVTVTRSLMPRMDRTSLVTDVDELGRCTVVSPATVAQRLNAIYPIENNGMLYFTLIYAVLDVKNNHLYFATAGHPGPVLISRGNDAYSIDVPAVPVGILDQPDYEDTEIRLSEGDRVYFFSDGLFEERNDQGDEFGRDRLCEVIDDSYSEDLNTSIDNLLNANIRWRGDDRFRDDVSVLTLEIQAIVT